MVFCTILQLSAQYPTYAVAKDTFPRITITDPSKSITSDIVTKSYSWTYKGKPCKVNLPLKNSYYNYYKALTKSLPYERYAEDHAGYRYFKELCQQLDVQAQANGYEGIELVNYLTTFAQTAIPYVAEQGEYKKYPIETLMEYGGDCEDKSALLCALLNTYGFDACMVLLPKHMAVAISCDNCGGYYNHRGKKYSFIESTAGGWQIGQVPEESRYANATILEVTHTDYYKRPQPYYTKWDDKPTPQPIPNTVPIPAPQPQWTTPKPMPATIPYSYIPTTIPNWNTIPPIPYGQVPPQQGWIPDPIPQYAPLPQGQYVQPLPNTFIPAPNLIMIQPTPVIPPKFQILPNGSNGGKIIIFGQTLIKW